MAQNRPQMTARARKWVETANRVMGTLLHDKRVAPASLAPFWPHQIFFLEKAQKAPKFWGASGGLTAFLANYILVGTFLTPFEENWVPMALRPQIGPIFEKYGFLAIFGPKRGPGGAENGPGPNFSSRTCRSLVNRYIFHI